MSKRKKRIHLAGKLLFLIYLGVAIYFLFFAETLDRTMVSSDYRYNLKPLSEIKRFWHMRYTYGWQITLTNLAGNVICFMPFGFLIPFVSTKKSFHNIVSVTILAACFSICVEAAQLILKVGACDIDDVILNTIGGFLGYFIFKILDLIFHISAKR